MPRCTLPRPARTPDRVAARCTSPPGCPDVSRHSATTRPCARMGRSPLHGPSRVPGCSGALRADPPGCADGSQPAARGQRFMAFLENFPAPIHPATPVGFHREDAKHTKRAGGKIPRTAMHPFMPSRLQQKTQARASCLRAFVRGKNPQAITRGATAHSAAGQNQTSPCEPVSVWRTPQRVAGMVCFSSGCFRSPQGI